MHSSIQWDDVFSDQEIDEIIKYCSAQQKMSGEVSGGGVVDSKLRKSKVVFINPNQDNYWIFERFNYAIDVTNEKFFNFDLTGYNYIQYSEYYGSEGGKYDYHMDMFLDEEAKLDNTRKMSLSMLLNKPDVDFQGGEFQMNTGDESLPKNVEMIKGRIIFFPSFIIHRVKEVTEGVRRSLVIWVTGPQFK